MKTRKITIYLILCLFLMSHHLFGGVERWSNFLDLSVTGSSNSANTSVMVVQDDKFGTAQWSFIQRTNLVRNRILFEINEDAAKIGSESVGFRVNLEVKLWNAGSSPSGNPSSTQLETMTIYFEADSKKSSAYRSLKEYTGAHKMEIRVINVAPVNTAWKGRAPGLRLHGTILVDRDYQFNCNNAPSLGTLADPSSDHFYTLAWTAMPGAESYDLEWTFYDKLSEVGQQIVNASNTTYSDFDWLFKNNATRVTINATSYKVNLVYPDGYLFFRVRGRIPKPLSNCLYSQWTAPQSSNLSNFPHKIKIDWHENNTLNFQSSIAFAEEGKNVPSVQYFDGTLRQRQNVVLSNSTNRTMVSQTLYDYHGRPAVQTMPAPSENNLLQFDPLFVAKSASEAFTKADFDKGACDFNAPSLSDERGLGKYYSSKNPLRNSGAHQYIPDAEGHPYTLTEYTPDLTGRIRRQSGVGKTFKLGSGKSTQYYYSKPTQGELDKLFGNNVGDASHYLKNSVIDPNGQISISYIDAHGRVIATSLGGFGPSNVEMIQSSLEGFAPEMELLNNVLEEDVWVSSHKIFLASEGQREFRYSLAAKTYEDACEVANVCYDCLYDLEITISDGACNDFNGGSPKVFKRSNFSFNSLTTDCNAANIGGPITFTTTINLPIGEYIIHKKLSLSQAPINTFLTHIEANNSCLPSLDSLIAEELAKIDFSDCQLDCNSCTSALGSQASFVADLQASYQAMGQQISQADAINIYKDRLAECADLCQDLSQCEIAYQSMLYDVSPGGQYALYEYDKSSESFNITDESSIFYDNNYQKISPSFYTNAEGTADSVYNTAGTLVPPTALNITEFIAHWKPSWAIPLVERYHPEYCIYQQWCLNPAYQSSDEFDRVLNELSSYEAALAGNFTNGMGILNDPFFATSAPGFACVALRDSMLDHIAKTDLSSPSLLDFVTNQVFGTGACNNGLGSGTVAENDLAWDIYRNIYLGIKQVLISKKQKELNCPISNCVGKEEQALCNGQNNLYRYKTARFLDLADADQAYTMTSAQAKADTIYGQIKTDCQDACMENADIWLSQLSPCDLESLSEGNQVTLKNRLIALCQTGCDVAHPFGASTSPSGSYSLYGDSSFAQIINTYFPTAADCNLACSHLNITSLAPYEQQQYEGPKTVLSLQNSCVCEQFTDLQNCYTADNKGYDSFETYLAQLADYSLSAALIDSLQKYCNTTTSSVLPKPLTIPAYLECGTCKPCSEITPLISQFENTCAKSHPDFYELLARKLNATLGFNRSAADYKTFEASCAASACAASNILCPRAADEFSSNGTQPNSCEQALREQAIANARLRYEFLKNKLLQDFDKGYRQNCLVGLEESLKGNILNQAVHYHHTLYYYDQAGNLVQTVPPKGVFPIDNERLDSVQLYRNGQSSIPLFPKHSYQTTYVYNSLNQVKLQISPDTEKKEFWYDKIGRLIVSQDGRQRPLNKYSYTVYDAQGRIIQVGEKESTTPFTDQLALTQGDYTTWLTTGNLNSRSQVTYTYYDQSPFTISAFDNSQQENLRTRVAATTFESIYDDNDASYDYGTHYTYDVSGNVKTLVQEIRHLQPINQQYKRLDYEYDYISGNVHQVYYQKGKADQFTHRYEYDENNRLLDVYSSQKEIYEEGLLWDREAAYEYYLHGPMSRMEIGAYRVQGMDYAYTLQGWIKGINSSGLLPDKDMGKDGLTTSGTHQKVARDALGYSLSYYQGDYKQIGTTGFEMAIQGSSLNMGSNNLYNGNIRYMSIHNKALGDPVAYSYKYDQLHRIKSMNSYHNANLSSFSWSSASNTPQYKMRSLYDGNGNILKMEREAPPPGSNTTQMLDGLDYEYLPGTNRLGKVTDNAVSCEEEKNITQPINEDRSISVSKTITANSTIGPSNKVVFKAGECICLLPGFHAPVTSGDFLAKIEDCDANQKEINTYQYDGNGNLVDNGEGGSISWSPYGKVLKVDHGGGSKVNYGYDAAQQRIMKSITENNKTIRHYYIRDAQGNIMAMYKLENNQLEWSEQHIYGSSRLGIMTPKVVLGASPPGDEVLHLGIKRYELSNHLGNVLAVVSDKLSRVDEDGDHLADFFEPTILSASDYFPFGLEIPNRTLADNDYRFGFNGKEGDRNGEWGSAVHYDYGFRIYNPKIGKFLSVDPLTRGYPSWTPYAFAMNRVIDGIDLDGLEWRQSTSLESALFDARGNGTLNQGDNGYVVSGLDGNYYTWVGRHEYRARNGTEIDNNGCLSSCVNYERTTFNAKAFSLDYSTNGGELQILDENGNVSHQQTNSYGLVRFPESGRGFDRYTTAANNENYIVNGTNYSDDNWGDPTALASFYNALQSF
jgi:RHS repeat-associated protein